MNEVLRGSDDMDATTVTAWGLHSVLTAALSESSVERRVLDLQELW
jgi:hypothetical protein